MKDISKKNCLIHGPGNLSDEYKVLGDFGSKYYKISPTKYRGNVPATITQFNRQQENNLIVNHAVDEILLQENDKVSAEAEAKKTLNTSSMIMIYIILKI